MIVFKEEAGNLYYQTKGVFKQLNNETYLNANILSSGLMSPEQVRKLDDLENSFRNFNGGGTTVIIENNTSLTRLVNGGNPVYMYFRDNVNIIPSINQISDIEPQPKPDFNLWWSNLGYYHTMYSSLNRSYIMKREVPSNLTSEEKKVLFLEIEVTTDTVPIEFLVIYQTQGGEVKRKLNVVQSGQNRKKIIVGLDDVDDYFYIVMYGTRFGVTATNLYKLGSSNEGRKGGTYVQIPRFPSIGQTYYCSNYPSGGTTKQAFLVYNGSEWKEVNLV